jgi:ABC-2 type transport system permease protein
MSEQVRRQAIAALAFLRMRLFRNHVRAFLQGSRLRLLMLVVCSAVFWLALFVGFFEGFKFLNSFINATDEIVEYLFGIFFLSLLVLLMVSTGIILYGGLFHSREVALLLAMPAGDDRIFAYKFVEAVAFSSWGFLLLGSPMMVAYGITAGAGWLYYALFLGFLIAFVLLAGSIGAIAAILVANYAPRRAKTVLALAVGVILLLGGLVIARLFQTPGEALSRDWLDAMLLRLTFSQHPLLPSRWMSKGLVGTARGEDTVGGYYLMVTSVQAAVVYLLAAVVARDLYRRGYSQVQGGRSTRRHHGLYLLDTLFHRLFAFVPTSIRLLILKDIRSFRRDPTQWSQFLIFFGLLAFYFINIRRLGYGEATENPYWRNLLAFLNLAVTALILSTFTTRFIFPLLSLEGRNFWILGLLPLRRESILWGKFAFAAGISLLATEALVVLSDVMLGIGIGMMMLHMFMVLILCLGLSGISVGLGAALPNLREDDPSKIAAGFGGTLNLLISLIFISLVVAALALPCRYYFTGQPNEFLLTGWTTERFLQWMSVSVVFVLVIGAVATFVPLELGRRKFQRMEL